MSLQELLTKKNWFKFQLPSKKTSKKEFFNIILSQMLIKLENIIKTYQLWTQSLDVLKWVNLNINQWEFVAIMWQSWSWKSTLMNIIGMLDVPSSGKYFFDNKDVSNLDDDEQSVIRSKTIGFVFQTYNLLPKTSALRQVGLPLMYQGIWQKERDERAFLALKKVWLADKTWNLPTELSGWQQQRVSIARAIVTNPSLILWDEPTGALDSKTGEEVMELFRQFNDEWKTVILITHDEEVGRQTRRQIHLKDWEIIK